MPTFLGKAKPKLTTKRRKHTNSKLGCLNCKTKKVRCDETLPICRNCSRGKNSTCSYLKLSKPEIDRIKLTHSLRDSQNRLLNLDYRLPTSSNGKNKEKAIGAIENSLEFKFELTNLPLRMPLIRLPPIQFNYLTINDFANEFTVIKSDDDNTTLRDDDAIPVIKNKGLSKAFHIKSKFKLIEHKIPKFYSQKDQNIHTDAVFDGPDWKPDMKYTFMDILSIFEDSSYDIKSVLAAESFALIGQALIVMRLKNKCRLLNEPTSIKKEINRIENNCYDKYRVLSVKTEKEIKSFVGSNISENRKNGADTVTFLSRAVKFIGFINIILKISADSYFKISNIREILISYYFKNIAINFDTLLPSIKYMNENLGYKILCIGIPSYKPSFFFEVISNLKSLSNIYSQDLVGYEDVAMKNSFVDLSFAYKNLLQFLDELSTQAFSERNDNLVTTYSPKLIFKFLQNWYSILPAESITYVPAINSNYPDESKFLNDIKTTLYLYYHAIGASLDSLFPACTYLYDTNFNSTNGTFYYDRTISTDRINCRFHKSLNTAGVLQRHNYYSMRLWAFFKRRYNFYVNLLKCENIFNEKVQSNRFGSRTKSLEVPIESFNTTLIRPEHYPKMVEKSSYQLVRSTEALLGNMYTRNIEKLSFFDETSILQYDHASMLLLRDYRPDEGEIIKHKPKIGYDVLKTFYEDKFILLEATRKNVLNI